MKKLAPIFCFFLFTISYCHESDSDTQTYELPMQLEESENESESQPIEIKITVTNNHIERSNNKTEVQQKKGLDKKLIEKKLQDREAYYSYVKNLALLAILISATSPTPSILSYLWKIIW
jgi:hypothetical protein